MLFRFYVRNRLKTAKLSQPQCNLFLQRIRTHPLKNLNGRQHVLFSDWLPADKTVGQAHLSRLSHKKKASLWPDNKSFIDQACSVNMARCWPRSFLDFFCEIEHSPPPYPTLKNVPSIAWPASLTKKQGGREDQGIKISVCHVYYDSRARF